MTSPLIDRQLRRRLTLAAVLSVGLNASACAAQLAAPGSLPGTVTPSEVLANPESFLNRQVQVYGRIYVEKYDLALPCIPNTGANCVSPAFTSLQIVTAGEPRSATNTVDLYRLTAEGEEQLRCTVIGQDKFDCGVFKEDAVATVSGRVVKHRIPIQEVGNSSGSRQVIQYREIYVLIVLP